MSGITEEELESFISDVSMRAYRQTLMSERPKILEWVPKLRQMSDSDFIIECASKIIDSAIMNRSQGTTSGTHAQTEICHEESERRHQLAGHDTDCRMPNLYTKAQRRARRIQGQPVHPLTSCTCGKEK